MKKFFEKCFIFTLVTLTFCSCSAKGVKIEQISGKYFVTKEKAFIIEKTKDDESSSDSKNYHIVIYEKSDSGNLCGLYENVKISKKDGKEFITADRLDIDLEIINDKAIKDTKNNLEYKESKIKDINSNLELVK
ncbi:hypothetical protein [uncultured Parvimonas sp.]|uniref:hypothetical protein n=1 Tax=uncultured Parvimonas sp. TaxID=747372 RepID=UPI0028D35071|nr:hypothetical protein [uncultured Parvimonas sp.]